MKKLNINRRFRWGIYFALIYLVIAIPISVLMIIDIRSLADLTYFLSFILTILSIPIDAIGIRLILMNNLPYPIFVISMDLCTAFFYFIIGQIVGSILEASRRLT
jgi:hypothetical protein